MHVKILVVGDAPTRQVRTAYPTVDECFIGGRYTGHLQPTPGATTAKVYGDALPAFEAKIAGMLSDRSVDMVRTTHQGDGVDQVRRRELDIAASTLGCVGFVVDGVGDPDDLSCGPLTPDEMAAYMAVQMSERYGLAPVSHPATLVALDRAGPKLRAWDAEVKSRVRDLPGDALISVVDAHI